MACRQPSVTCGHPFAVSRTLRSRRLSPPLCCFLLAGFVCKHEESSHHHSCLRQVQGTGKDTLMLDLSGFGGMTCCPGRLLGCLEDSALQSCALQWGFHEAPLEASQAAEQAILTLTEGTWKVLKILKLGSSTLHGICDICVQDGASHQCGKAWIALSKAFSCARSGRWRTGYTCSWDQLG